MESLIRKEKSPKTIVLSMTVNRLTGSKEIANLLHKCGHGISYTDVRHLNKNWAKEVTINNNHVLPSTLATDKYIRVAIHNSDKKQQTITGSKTAQIVYNFRYKSLILQKKLQLKQNKERLKDKSFFTRSREW